LRAIRYRRLLDVFAGFRRLGAAFGLLTRRSASSPAGIQGLDQMRLVRVVILMVTATLGAAACDERLSDFTGPTPNLTPTFSSIQRDIFSAPDSSGRPACTGCHVMFGRRPPSGDLNLVGENAYANLVNAPSLDKRGAIRVIPGDPENSYLIHKLEGRSGIVGDRMPEGGPFLTDGQIAVIKRWIERGAPND
jgi:hypothetical protein